MAVPAGAARVALTGKEEQALVTKYGHSIDIRQIRSLRGDKDNSCVGNPSGICSAGRAGRSRRNRKTDGSIALQRRNAIDRGSGRISGTKPERVDVRGLLDTNKLLSGIRGYLSVLCTVPDTKDLDGLGANQPIGDDVGGQLWDHEFPRTLFDSGFSALGEAWEDLDGIVDDAANPIGGGEITLALDVTGNDFKIVEG